MSLRLNLSAEEVITVIELILARYKGLRVGSLQKLLRGMQRGDPLQECLNVSKTMSQSWLRKTLITCCNVVDDYVRLTWPVLKDEEDWNKIEIRWMGDGYRLTLYNDLPIIVAQMCYKLDWSDYKVGFLDRGSDLTLKAVNLWLACRSCGIDGGPYLDMAEDGEI